MDIRDNINKGTLITTVVMTSYAKNSFKRSNQARGDRRMRREIDECKESQGYPSHYCITHTHIGEDILIDDISTLDEAVSQLITVLNDREWVDDDLYVSIEGIYKEKGLIVDLNVEQLNENLTLMIDESKKSL